MKIITLNQIKETLKSIDIISAIAKAVFESIVNKDTRKY